VRRVAGLDRDAQDVVVRGQKAVRGTFEQDATPKCCGRLAGRSRHEPVDVEPREVQARRDRLAGCLALVQRPLEDVDEAGEGVGCRAHAPDAANTLAVPA